MAWNRDLREEQRRIDAAISRATSAHMSDTKWRKLFCALDDAGAPPIRWKFVRSASVYSTACPKPRDLLEHTLEDVLPYPYGPYREIEWIEIATDNPSQLRQRLLGVGQLPLIEIPDGLRVVGYSWPEDAGHDRTAQP